MQHIIKLCADHLRAFVKNNHAIKLKASHAHELVAAFFGYQSKASLLADTQHPLTNLPQAKFIVLCPTDPIDQRCPQLKELSSDLPDTYTLGEVVYSGLIDSGLISEKFLVERLWPTYEKLATYLADEYLRQQKMEKIYRSPVREGVKVQHQDESVCLIVSRFYQLPIVAGGVLEETITTSITLQRIACYFGYANPEISAKAEKRGRRQ